VRAAVRLRNEGKSYRAIANALGISGPAAFKLVQRWADWVRERRLVIPAE
jgi:hypothetical protein